MIESTTIAVPARPAAPVRALRLRATCDVCKQTFAVQVSAAELAAAPRYPFAHLILHGSPIHCLTVYVDKNGAVRCSESSRSLQIDRTSATFAELVKWWAMTAEGDA
ncbi:MAG: hypothetical protein Q6370_023390 [Candidatus Sigynarchaeota archaeon]